MASSKVGQKAESAAAVVETDEALREANQRAESAEAELAALKKQMKTSDEGPEGYGLEKDTLAEDALAKDSLAKDSLAKDAANREAGDTGGEAELRKDSMMAHLLDSLEAKKDIGHYGRLVFAMVARHFMPHEEVLGWLMRDSDFEAGAAEAMLRQVEGRDYNPPKRERIVEWQAEQEFPILPKPDDPDCGNLYRNLKFPDAIYQHIEHYQEQKVAAE